MSILAAILITFAPDTSYRAEDVTYRNGAVELAAVLMTPKTPGPHAAAVIIQGSGPSDRTNGWAKAIAEEIVGNGVAVLLTDKRGSGASGGDWRTASFEDLAGDALAGVSFLRTRSDIDGRKIGLAGLSQGGWIAPLAATGPHEIAFVIDVSGAAVSFAEQSMHEMANTARQAGLAPDGVAGVLALNRAAARYLITDDWLAYDDARKKALSTPWSKLAAGFPADRNLPIWTFLKAVAAFDPMPYWLQVDAPALIVYGEEDEADNVPVQESVRRLEWGFSTIGKTNARIVVIPQTGHALLTRERNRLMPEFTAVLADFLRAAIQP